MELSITPADGQVPTATINGSQIELTEDGGVYIGSFAMPARASTLVIIDTPFYVLEREIVGVASFYGSFGSRWEGRSSGSRIRLTLNRREGRCTRSDHGRHLTADNVVSADLVEPTTIVLMGVDVELDGEILTILDVELLDTVLSEETEHTLAGILSGHLDDILLRHPRVASTV